MNESDKRELSIAMRLIDEAYLRVSKLVSDGHLVQEDVDAAILASLLKAVQIEAEQHGLTIDRLLREIS
jgi:hypothetical protein